MSEQHAHNPQAEVGRATEAELAALSPFGRWLEENRAPGRRSMWRLAMFGLLALLLALNFVVPNHHPHFEIDDIPGFWPAFGLGLGVIMIFLVKKIVQPLIKRPEDYYGDL
ncbi:hypothetical protein LJB99_03485 [Deltaproteobacteria bacterium OttesenSCG-928-K17]|nr:hypothetical protein [Deltaproteobacteria bacterium OttesenSCG-928-K17]